MDHGVHFVTNTEQHQYKNYLTQAAIIICLDGWYMAQINKQILNKPKTHFYFYSVNIGTSILNVLPEEGGASDSAMLMLEC